MRVVVLFMVVGTFLSSARAQTNPHVIHLSVDGLHSEGLRWLMQSQPDLFTNFQRFIDEGATTFDARTDYFNTFTLPNHTSMLTGRPVAQPGEDTMVHHGYTNNSTPKASDTLHNAGNPDLFYVASTFDIAHDYGLKTALYASKPKFVIYEQSYNATDETAGGRPDRFPGNGDQGTDKIDQYVFLETNGTSSELIDRYVTDMPEEHFEYTFLHLTEPDAAGHSLGWRSEAWNQSVTLVDQHLGRVLEMIQEDESLRDRTTIVLTSDHGGLGLFHDDASNPNMYRVPFFVWGQGVVPGSDLYELNLGTRLRPLAGRPTYDAPIQPIRNGDGANLAMSLLDLPSVDGSFMNVRQDLLVDRAQSAVWHGTNSNAGDPGDGRSWNDPLNWARGSDADVMPRPGDDLEFAANSEKESIQLAGNRTVRSLDFLGDYSFRGGDLHVISGEIRLAEGVLVQVDGSISSQTSLLIDGSGTLEVIGTMPDLLQTGGLVGGSFDVDGSATFLDRVRPGTDVGMVSVGRDVTLGSGSVLEMQIGETADGVLVYDSIDVANRLSIRGGGIDVLTLGEYEDPSEDAQFDRFPLLSAGRRVGNIGFLDYNGTRLSFDFVSGALATGTTHTHFAGDGLFRILEHHAGGVMLTNYRAFAGDANGDGAFNSQDFVSVFQAGLYEDGDNDNANWLSGDWNGDLDFDSGDLVTAFRDGRFELESVFHNDGLKLVPEPSQSPSLIILSSVAFALPRRRIRRFDSRRVA